MHNEAATDREWDEIVAAHAKGSILQTRGWGKLKSEFGWDWDLARAGESGALILYRPLPLSLGAIAYAPRGPVVDWRDSQATAALWQEMKATARRRRAWALWVEPPLLDAPDARSRLQALGMRPTLRTIQPPRTIEIDLTPSEEDILMRMKSKTRYNIRLAERKGVQVREGDLQDVSTFHQLIEATSERNEFGVHSARYYQRVMEIFHPQGQASLWLAEVEGDVVAGIIVAALGDRAWYFYGASSSRHRKKMPTYALQWAAIRWAKARGCATYDLWGIPDADEETLEAEFTQRSDGLWGVYRFKRGFGGEVTRFVGLWETPLHPLYPLAARLYALREGRGGIE